MIDTVLVDLCCVTFNIWYSGNYLTLANSSPEDTIRPGHCLVKKKTLNRSFLLDSIDAPHLKDGIDRV